jgi:hypothetical protein
MSYLPPIGRGLYCAASALGSGVSKVAKGGASAAKGTVTAVGFVTIPRTFSVGIAAGVTGWYAKQTAFSYAPQVLSKLCIQATIRAVGNAALGEFIAKTVVIPAVVPVATPIVAKIVGVAALLAATGMGNAIYHYTKEPSVGKQAQLKSSGPLEEGSFDPLINEFERVEFERLSATDNSVLARGEPLTTSAAPAA